MNDAIRRKIIISNFYYELDKILMERFNRHITLLDISKLEYIMNLGEEETINYFLEKYPDVDTIEKDVTKVVNNIEGEVVRDLITI